MNEVTVGGSYKEAIPFLIQTITPLHVGTGQSYEGFVDLPIQRDNLGFPVIWGSSLKGAIRNTYHNNGNMQREEAVFGSDEYASSILITDASLLLMPVRSLYGLYAFITNKLLLSQCLEKLRICNIINPHKYDLLINELEKLISNLDNSCRCSNMQYLSQDKKTVVLRETSINVEEDKDVENVFNKLIPNDILFKDDIIKKIVIVNEEHSDIIKRSTLLQTRIKLGYKEKHVEEGPWTEEFLPEMSLLMNVIMLNNGRGNLKGVDNIKKELADGLHANNELNQFYIVVGGDETIGRGIIRFNKV